jgi:hypothetical protein
MNKYSHIEAERVMAIFEEMVEKLLVKKKTEMLKSFHCVKNEMPPTCLSQFWVKLRTHKKAASETREGLRTYQMPPLKMFVKSMVELKDYYATKLVTTVEEDRSKADFLADIVAKEQKAKERNETKEGESF